MIFSSGITEKDLSGVTTTLENVHEEIQKIITPRTILVGQSLESDLKALRVSHFSPSFCCSN
jgi:RNA exonuclease 1